MLDACCTGPAPVLSATGPRNRYLTFNTDDLDPSRVLGLGDEGQPVAIYRPRQAIRVTIMKTPALSRGLEGADDWESTWGLGTLPDGRVSVRTRPSVTHPSTNIPRRDREGAYQQADAGALLNQSFWVGPPQLTCENSGQDFDVPIDDCGSAPGAGSLTLLTATLQCDPFFTNWLDLGEVNVHHQLIMPDTTYAIEVINEGCALTTAANYSPALVVTNPIWGDVVRDCSSLPCPGPDNSVDVVTDVTAVLDKFRNALTAASKARSDLEPSSPDGLINISDVTFVLVAFGGADYPFTPTTLPCAQ